MSKNFLSKTRRNSIAYPKISFAKTCKSQTDSISVAVSLHATTRVTEEHACGTTVWLKFGTRIRGLKANTSINFGVNLITIEGVISDFTHKVKANFCHAYRVNRASRNNLKSVCR